MKWYFASRTKHKESIKKIIKILKEEGHQIVYDWTFLDSFNNLEDRLDKSKIANEMLRSISDAEIFVLLSDKGGTDMFVELGFAIAKLVENKKLRIYAIGKYNKRSLMHFHPSIIHLNNLIDVFNKECPEIAHKFSALLLSF